MKRFETRREIALRLYNTMRDHLYNYPYSDSRSADYPSFFVIINRYTLHIAIEEYTGKPLGHPDSELYTLSYLLMPPQTEEYPYWEPDPEIIQEIVDNIY